MNQCWYILFFFFLHFSVESLPESPVRLRDYLELLVVFDYDTLIPSRALETIWNTDDLDTESYMSGEFLTFK